METKLLSAKDHRLMDESGFFYILSSDKTFNRNAHTHDFYEMFCVLSGEVKHTLNGRTEILKKGCIAFIRPFDTHIIEKNGGENGLVAMIAFTADVFRLFDNIFGEFLKGYFLPESGCPAFNLTDLEFRELEEEINYVQLLKGKQAVMQLKLILSFAFRVISVRFNDIGYTKYENSLSEILGAMNYEENIAEGVGALLKISNLSHGHLCRIFKDKLNITPTQYVTNKRMSYASQLLIHSSIDILSIALMIGYSSYSHFAKCFKREFKMNPCEYRKQNQNNH